jgi:hypothetical protein
LPRLERGRAQKDLYEPERRELNCKTWQFLR